MADRLAEQHRLLDEVETRLRVGTAARLLVPGIETGRSEVEQVWLSWDQYETLARLALGGGEPDTAAEPETYSYWQHVGDGSLCLHALSEIANAASGTAHCSEGRVVESRVP